MKTKISLLLAVTLLSITGYSQNLLQNTLIQLANSGITQASNYAIEPYLTYAPKVPKGSKVGGGVFVAYNINDYVGAGIGLDYLGQFSIVSANVQLKVATHPFRNITWFNGALTNVSAIPFAIAGLGKATGGNTAGAIAVTDAGMAFQVGHWAGGKFTLGGCYGRWDNAGIYSGPRYHIFFGWSRGF